MSASLFICNESTPHGDIQSFLAVIVQKHYTRLPVADARDAWAAACEIGGPVVVKPRDGNQGRGMGVNLASRGQVEAAYAVAAEISGEVLVERYIPGQDYRMLVVGNKLIAAARRDPPQVIGDGTHTISQLVEQVNSDPRRGEGHANSLTKIHLDEIALAHLATQGLTAESFPPEGARIFLRNNANLSTGGTASDVTDDVHPELAACVEAAAQMIGLDICGIDVVCDSVASPLEEQGGVIKINAAPGLRMHLQPSFGKGRTVGEAIIANMFKDGDAARIPVVAVTGTNGKTTTVRLIANILGCQGLRVGMTSTATASTLRASASIRVTAAAQRVQKKFFSTPMSTLRYSRQRAAVCCARGSASIAAMLRW